MANADIKRDVTMLAPPARNVPQRLTQRFGGKQRLGVAAAGERAPVAVDPCNTPQRLVAHDAGVCLAQLVELVPCVRQTCCCDPLDPGLRIERSETGV